MTKTAAMALAALALASLSALAASAPRLSPSARRGLAFAEQRCSGCHAVRTNRMSPNPESPPFEQIANYPELTSASLREFLADSHNYPAAMNFQVAPSRIGDLAAYILTMRKHGYRQPIM